VNGLPPADSRLVDLSIAVRQARHRRDLYRAMLTTQDSATSKRLGELMRNCVSAEDDLRRAELHGSVGTPRSSRSYQINR